MSVREILQDTGPVWMGGIEYPHILRCAVPLRPLEQAEIDTVGADLRDTFAATRGCIGLAAPQLGYRVRAIIVDVTADRHETLLMFNPVIVKADDTQMVRDGCLSVEAGRRHAFTRRPKRIIVEWGDEHDQPRRAKFNGLLAACIHHEIDHLDGVLFLDRVMAPR